jgi:hypothetical protein
MADSDTARIRLAFSAIGVVADTSLGDAARHPAHDADHAAEVVRGAGGELSDRLHLLQLERVLAENERAAFRITPRGLLAE